MARILRQTTVVRDGMHNGFTDLQYWQGCYWVSYRKGQGHTSMDASATVAVSSDRTRFREVAHVHVRGDNRDPKLLPIDEERCALYFPSWTRGARRPDSKKYLQQFITFSDNGHSWEAPQSILAPGNWLWRVRFYQGRYYGLVYGNGLDLAVSDDLLNWETLAHLHDDANESDIVWHEDGEAWIVARHTNETSLFLSAKPPYTEWETTELKTMVHAPVMLFHEGALYVAGRNNMVQEGVTTWPFSWASLGVWRVKRGDLEPVLRIPATGDCSYPGLIKDPDGRICLSYYSKHAYHMGFTAAPEGIARDDDPSGATNRSANDVYFAEIELPPGSGSTLKS